MAPPTILCSSSPNGYRFIQCFLEDSANRALHFILSPCPGSKFTELLISQTYKSSPHKKLRHVLAVDYSFTYVFLTVWELKIWGQGLRGDAARDRQAAANDRAKERKKAKRAAKRWTLRICNVNGPEQMPWALPWGAAPDFLDGRSKAARAAREEKEIVGSRVSFLSEIFPLLCICFSWWGRPPWRKRQRVEQFQQQRPHQKGYWARGAEVFVRTANSANMKVT